VRNKTKVVDFSNIFIYSQGRCYLKEESMMDWELPVVDQKKCTACGTCVDACLRHVLELLGNNLEFTHPQDCTYCATCEEVCPEGAIVCSYEIIWASEEEQL
jgi:ferredoxin